MRVSEIRVKRIHVNQGLGALSILIKTEVPEFCKKQDSYCTTKETKI